jgi:hypothetical protein
MCSGGKNLFHLSDPFASLGLDLHPEEVHPIILAFFQFGERFFLDEDFLSDQRLCLFNLVDPLELEDETAWLRGGLQNFVRLGLTFFVLDENLTIEGKTVKVFSEIRHLHLSLDPVGFDHPPDGEKILLHRPLSRFLKKSRNLLKSV